jgi:hypothetical protein
MYTSPRISVYPSDFKVTYFDRTDDQLFVSTGSADSNVFTTFRQLLLHISSACSLHGFLQRSTDFEHSVPLNAL